MENKENPQIPKSEVRIMKFDEMEFDDYDLRALFNQQQIPKNEKLKNWRKKLFSEEETKKIEKFLDPIVSECVEKVSKEEQFKENGEKNYYLFPNKNPEKLTIKFHSEIYEKIKNSEWCKDKDINYYHNINEKFKKKIKDNEIIKKQIQKWKDSIKDKNNAIDKIRKTISENLFIKTKENLFKKRPNTDVYYGDSNPRKQVKNTIIITPPPTNLESLLDISSNKQKQKQ